MCSVMGGRFAGGGGAADGGGGVRGWRGDIKCKGPEVGTSNL